MSEMLSKVALGEVPPDAVIRNGILFNVFTREFIDGQSIWVKDGQIAYVGPDQENRGDEETELIDVDGMVLLPGLIEGHTHATSNRSGIEEFVRHTIPSGVTTVVTETIELGSVVGKDGMDHTVKALEDQPIRFYYTVAPLCGLTRLEEVNALSDEDMLFFLKDPKCLGVGEIYWGNMFAAGEQGQRLKRLSAMTLGLGKRVEGHTAGASGRKLQAYTSFGVSSCHEPITDREVLERLRLGYWVMIREGAIRRELEGVKGIFEKEIDFRRLILATDGVDPEGFLEEGCLDASLRRALRLGVLPEIAYQMVTLNVAEHFRLDHLIGSLSPGKMADLVAIPSRNEFSPKLVMCNGRVIFKDGRNMVEPKKIFFPAYMFDSVKIKGYTIPSFPGSGRVRVMELVSRLVTKEAIVDLKASGESEDIIMALALDRVKGREAFGGFLKGFGLRRGACGTTMSWDTVDMIVVGCDIPSIRTVIERLKEIGGGAVYAIGDEVVREFPAPLCGIVSLKPMETVRDEVKRLEDCLRDNGVKWEKPVLTIDTLGSPAIPHLRITHHGYVRLKDREVLPVEA